MMLVAWIVDWSMILKRPTFGALLTATFVVVAIYVAKIWSERDVPPQRIVIDAIHRAFPEPVAVIDNSHMVASFPKRGPFMSTWGLANYFGGKPIFAEILRRDTVPLLMLDNEELADAVEAQGLKYPRPLQRLFDEDRAILSQNYIQHWGPIWVAGKRLDPVGQNAVIEILRFPELTHWKARRFPLTGPGSPAAAPSIWREAGTARGPLPRGANPALGQATVETDGTGAYEPLLTPVLESGLSHRCFPNRRRVWLRRPSAAVGDRNPLTRLPPSSCIGSEG